MRQITIALGAVAVFAVSLIGAAPALAAEPCLLGPATVLPVRVEGGRVVADVEINGAAVSAIIDTGADRTLLQRAKADALGLKLISTDEEFFGVGGHAKAFGTRIKDFKLGSSSAKDVYMTVIDSAVDDRHALIIGQDIMRSGQMEIDLRGNALRFFRPTGECAGKSMAYWGPALVARIEERDPKNGHIAMTVLVNGKPFKAMVDTGASTTIMTTQAAATLGVKPGGANVVAAYSGGGIGSNAMQVYHAAFDSFELAGEKINKPVLRIGNMYRGAAGPQAPDMLIGLDFLWSHRVFVSYYHREFFFSYLGGKVFPPMPAAAPQPRTAESEPKAAQ